MLQYSTLDEWFNSPWYRLLHDTYNQEKTNFISSLISYLKPPSDSKMLQAGSGTGVHAAKIAEMGFDVTGIDPSFEDTGKAKELEKDNLRFFQHDMRLPFWINYFDYAFNLFTTFGYFKTLREHDNSIRVISQSLKTNGVFVMDYLNVHYEEDHLEQKQLKNFDGAELHTTNWQDEENFFKKIEIFEQGNYNELFTEKFAKLSLGDFTDMFAYQGLQIQEVFGDYNFADYNIRTSPRLIFTAKKIRR